MHMNNTHEWKGGACAFKTVCIVPSRIQKYLFIMLLEALSCFFPNKAASVFVGGLILYR